jgi:hypothetical protein
MSYYDGCLMIFIFKIIDLLDIECCMVMACVLRFRGDLEMVIIRWPII